MEWIGVLLIIILGLSLVVVEIFLIPGLPIVGLVGFILSCYGIYLGFDKFGKEAGIMILGLFILLLLVSFLLSLKSSFTEKISLKNTINSKARNVSSFNLQAGMIGKAISSLRPSGKAEFKGEIMEVRTRGEYIDANADITIVEISENFIIVKTIS